MKASLSDALKTLYPDVKLGILVIDNVVNKDFDDALEIKKKEAETFIRKNFVDFNNLIKVKSYNKFYKKYDKKFPIEFQLKSIISGKPIPTVSVLVEAMFLSELLNQALVAGYDLNHLDGDLILELANGNEDYIKINNEKQVVKKNDIILKDSQGIIGSVLYGPDLRTKINKNTTSVMYVGYFVFDFLDDEIVKVMQDIANNVVIANPNAKIGSARIVKFGDCVDI